MNALLHVLSRCDYNHSSCNLLGSVTTGVRNVYENVCVGCNQLTEN